VKDKQIKPLSMVQAGETVKLAGKISRYRGRAGFEQPTCLNGACTKRENNSRKQ
jgi:hypothetical protein